MSRNPIDWPAIGHFTAEDSSGKHHRIEVRRRPGATGTSVGGGLWIVSSDAHAFFLDSGMPVTADMENEGVFFSVTSDEVYRKV